MQKPKIFNPPPEGEEPVLEEMSRGELLEYREEIRQQLADLDAREPRNMESEAYDLWADRHETLEDVLDDILDLLEE